MVCCKFEIRFSTKEKQMKSFYQKIILLLLLIVSPNILSAQCAMCRAALQTGDQQNIAEGINHGITYLMMFPYILVGILGYVVYRIIKKETTTD